MPLGRIMRLESVARTPEGAPHVRRRRVVVAETFLGLLEVPADDVRELPDLDDHVGVEGIEVVHADHARRHVPFVVSGALVFRDDIGFRPIVLAEHANVVFRIPVADRLVGKELK